MIRESLFVIALVSAISRGANAALYQFDFSGAVSYEDDNEFSLGEHMTASLVLDADNYHTNDSFVTTQIYYNEALVSDSMSSAGGYTLSGSVASGVSPHLVVRNDWLARGSYLDGYDFDFLHGADSDSTVSSNLASPYNAYVLLHAVDTSPVNNLDIPTSLTSTITPSAIGVTRLVAVCIWALGCGEHHHHSAGRRYRSGACLPGTSGDRPADWPRPPRLTHPHRDSRVRAPAGGCPGA